MYKADNADAQFAGWACSDARLQVTPNTYELRWGVEFPMIIRCIATTTAIVFLGACAATPLPPPTNLAAAPAVAPAIAPASAPAANSAEADHLKALARSAKELDYQVEKRDGQVFYCQTSAQLGTRFKTKGCLNEADFEDVVRRSTELQQIMRQPSNCNNQSCIHN